MLKMCVCAFLFLTHTSNHNHPLLGVVVLQVYDQFQFNNFKTTFPGSIEFHSRMLTNCPHGSFTNYFFCAKNVLLASISALAGFFFCVSTSRRLVSAQVDGFYIILHEKLPHPYYSFQHMAILIQNVTCHSLSVVLCLCTWHHPEYTAPASGVQTLRVTPPANLFPSPSLQTVVRDLWVACVPASGPHMHCIWRLRNGPGVQRRGATARLQHVGREVRRGRETNPLM